VATVATNAVSIIEVGPRDGLQSEPEILSTSVKLEFIRRAIDAGIRRMEVTSFVHPKRVPQMADAEDIIRGLPDRDDLIYIGLVLNKKGFERARDVNIDEIGMAGIRANVMVSSAFGCPFEGEVPVARILEIVKQIVDGEPVELGIADSIGVAVPTQVTDLLGAVQEIVPDLPIRCHFHNTRNTGLANAQAALEAGVASLDASIGGIGGCPFAPAATGNIPTDDLLYMLDRSGVQSGVSLDKIIETSNWLQEQLGRDVPAMLPKAGIFPQVAEQRRAAG
jgi:hydroxymethylglutaryl-CoA lyase